MTGALEGGEWSAARPGRTLTPGKTQYPFYRRLVGPQGRSGRAEIVVPTGIRSRTVQPYRSLYRLSYPAHISRVQSLIVSGNSWEHPLRASYWSFYIQLSVSDVFGSAPLLSGSSIRSASLRPQINPTPFVHAWTMYGIVNDKRVLWFSRANKYREDNFDFHLFPKYSLKMW